MIWASTYLCDCHGFSLDTGAKFASLTYIGITVGRAICGFFADKIGDKRLIRWGLVVMFLGIVLMIVSTFTIRELALAGLLIFGFGCSPVYPCIIHATPDNFGADKASAIIGMQMAFAYTGIAAMPPLFGLIAQKYVFTLPYYILALCILLVVFSEIVNKVAAKARENQNLSADASNE